MKNLKALRKSRHLSQQKLAEQFGLSQQSIYKYENNLAEPDIETLKKFADFFHVSVDALIGYNGDTFSDLPQNSSSHITLSPDELHHLYLYRNLSDKMQMSINTIIEELAGTTSDILSEPK